MSCIILLDFTENYHYMVWDKIQGYHWTKDHPAVVYFKNGNTDYILSLIILRIISDYIKLLPNIRLTEYSGQYKNYKNFINLCHH